MSIVVRGKKARRAPESRDCRASSNRGPGGRLMRINGRKTASVIGITGLEATRR
jgi:hypothetical protein